MSDDLRSKIKFGWRKDKEDTRDYLWKARPQQIAELPPSADLRRSATKIEQQGALGACSGHAGTGLFEWFEKEKTGKEIDRSRSFLYKEAQDIAGIRDDSGAYLRDVASVMANEGLPPEDAWEYSRYPEEPTDEVKALATKTHVDSYWRLDGASNEETLLNLKTILAIKQLPNMFGFNCYNSIFNVKGNGIIPIPTGSDSEAGGHAVACMGYSDAISALLIKNSWGVEWGAAGWGWLPYWYVLSGKVSDCWVIAKESQILDPVIGDINMFLDAVRGTDNAVWYQTYKDGVYSKWISIGGITTSDVQVQYDTETGTFDVRVRGTDTMRYHNYYDPKTGKWSGWGSAGGLIRGITL